MKAALKLALDALEYRGKNSWQKRQPAIVAARQALEQPVSCTWAVDEDGTWESACGEAWTFTEGGPLENNYRFCHGCGKPVDVNERKYADMADEIISEMANKW